MAERSGKAGKSTREMAGRRGKQVVLWLVLGLGAMLVIYLLLNNAKAWGLSGGVILGLLLFMRIVPDLVVGKAKKKEKEERRANRGAAAEEKVGELLGGLGETFDVLHDVISPYGNIDHLVISRDGGIFMVETKAHGGKVTCGEGKLLVNGHDPEKDFIRQCLNNSYWVRDQVESIIGTKPWVTPVLVFTNAFVERNSGLQGVMVVNKKFLLRVIEERKGRRGDTEMVWERREEIVRKLI